MEKLKFKRFQDVGRRPSREPMVTIVQSGNLNFNKSFMENLIEKDKKFIRFHYDKSNRVIGLELLEEQKEYSYRIRSYRDDKLGAVTAIAFLKANKIPFGSLPSSAYKAKWSEEYGMILINLKDEIK